MDNADAVEEARRLLLDILPLFTFSPGWERAAKDVCSMAYYTLICAEANRLEEFLKQLDTRMSQYADVLETVLKLFENRLIRQSVSSPVNLVLHIRQSKYERLPALRSRIQAAKASRESFVDLQKFLHFGDRLDETRDIHYELTQCNKAFTNDEDNLPSWGGEDKIYKRTPAYDVRDHATSLYRTLLGDLSECGKAEHEAKLCLTTYESSLEQDLEIDFELLFSTHTARWQETRIGVIMQKEQSTLSRVKFESQLPKNRMIRREIEGKICDVIVKTSKFRGNLHMLVDHNRKFYRLMSASPQRSGLTTTHDLMSLKTIIEKLEEERLAGNFGKKRTILGRKHKRIVAVLLSHALLQYCGSAWMSENWDKSSISFLRHSMGDRLVLSSSFKPYETRPDMDAEYRMHPYPGVLALAILMLEMELGKTIETARSEQEDFGDDGETNINNDYGVAWNMFENNEIEDDTIPGFKAAVKGCLNFSYWNENTDLDNSIYHREKLYDDIALRRKIYQEIVSPLEQELYMSFPTLNLDEPLSFLFWDLSHPRSFQHEKKEVFMPHTIPCMGSKDALVHGASISGKISSYIAEGSLTAYQVFFHDASIAISEESRGLSKKWLEDYMDAWHSLVDRIKYQTHLDTSRVKIAVLDTGIDWSDSYIRGAKDRIEGWKNWTNDRRDQDAKQQVYDSSGHGTHVAALLLKTAPEAKIYVSRVADHNGMMTSAENIAEAIEHAVKTWEVDIITMSFGFQKSITAIDKAIKFAFSRDVIMFAATSNDGGNEEVAFPASAYEIVIGVNSTNAYGNKSYFTPNVLPLSENFSILGEAVESSWPKHLKQGSRQCRSGTSYATPIAAGTAANMILYSRMNIEDQETAKRVVTCRGMKKLLLTMAAQRDGYNYIRPWTLWRKDEKDILAQIITALG